MERVAAVFTSFADADQAESEYYAKLSPAERIEILLELAENHRRSLGRAAERFERVCQFVDLAER
jgi:hypothetical protein